MHSQNATRSYKIWSSGSYDTSLAAILINHNVYDVMKVSALLLYLAKEILSYTIQQSDYDDYDEDYDDDDEGFFNDFCNGVCDDHEIDEIFDDVEDAFSDIQDEFLEREKKLNDESSSGYFVQFTSQSREQAKASRLVDMALDRLESTSKRSSSE